MVNVFTIDAYALSREGEESVADCERAQRSLGLAQHMPFLLHEDGQPVREANQWLRALPTRGCASPLSWKAYAGDFADWLRFLDTRRTTPLAATREDLAAYHSDLRLGDGGVVRTVSASTWNRRVAALDSFYQWALDEELIERTPFTYRNARFATADGSTVVVTKNLAKEKVGRGHAQLKWLAAEQLKFFLEVGMSGLLPSGVEDESFRGRQAPRNRAIAELMAGAGLRHQEAGHLLAAEVPALPERRMRFVRMDIPEAICKGARGRWTLLSYPALQQIHSYLRLERSNTLVQASWHPSATARLVTDIEVNGGRVDGQRRVWNTLRPEQREQLVLTDGGSPLWALTSTGAPLTDFDAIFSAATARCQRFEPTFPDVTPHTLRHTFAVHMLRWLIEQVAEAINRKADHNSADLWGGYWRVHDPLLTLRDLLGHRSVMTTQIYLHAIDATRLYANVMEELDLEAERSADVEPVG